MLTVPGLLIVPEMGIVLGRESFLKIVTLQEMVTILAMMTMTMLGVVIILLMVTGPVTIRSLGF